MEAQVVLSTLLRRAPLPLVAGARVEPMPSTILRAPAVRMCVRVVEREAPARAGGGGEADT